MSHSIDLFDEVHGTGLALKFLKTVRQLLCGGKNWTPREMARNRHRLGCDPLSEEAVYFDLRGAAVRARWMMREQIAETEVTQYHVKHVLHALSSTHVVVTAFHQGWELAEAVLTGLEAALVEYEASIKGVPSPEIHNFTADQSDFGFSSEIPKTRYPDDLS